MLNTVEHKWNEGFEMGVTCQFVLVLVEEEKNSFLSKTTKLLCTFPSFAHLLTKLHSFMRFSSPHRHITILFLWPRFSFASLAIFGALSSACHLSDDVHDIVSRIFLSAVHRKENSLPLVFALKQKNTHIWVLPLA